MTFIKDVLSTEELKKSYRSLAMNFHPDKGGSVDIMQQINNEYSIWQKGFSDRPRFLQDLKVGNTIFVNGSKCIVIEVSNKLFKAKSLETSRESYFDKETGYGQFNLKIRAYIDYDILENVN